MNTTNQKILIDEFKKISDDVDSKLKICTLSMVGSRPVIGLNSNDISVYVYLKMNKEAVIYQKSGNYDIGELNIINDVIIDIINNYDYIDEKLLSVDKLFDLYM